MLAPRKKLWPTPRYVIDAALELAGVTRDDVVLDLGCGDGRVLIAAAKKCGARAVGYEINAARAAEAVAAADAAGVAHLVDIRVGNALNADLDEIRPTVAILFLIERGLRAAVPLLAAGPCSMRLCCYTYAVPRDARYAEGAPGPAGGLKYWCQDPGCADRKVPIYFYTVAGREATRNARRRRRTLFLRRMAVAAAAVTAMAVALRTAKGCLGGGGGGGGAEAGCRSCCSGK
jgi:SAM-dependent methyltransferase